MVYVTDALVPSLIGLARVWEYRVMNGDENQVSEDLWREAAGRVQADQDIDVLMEARGLMIAEMSDVTAIDRRRAVFGRGLDAACCSRSALGVGKGSIAKPLTTSY